MKKTRSILLTFLLLVGIYFSFNIATADNVGGSINDPLVTKSYVDKKLADIDELSERLEKKLADLDSSSDRDYDRKDKRDEEDRKDDKKSDDYKKLEEKVALLEQANAEQKQELDKKNAEQKDAKAEGDSSKPVETADGFLHSDFFTVIEAKQGQKLLLGRSAECVLRAGEGLVVMGEYGGLADLTDGKDLRQDASVPAQHLLLSSRNDGRGIFVTSENISYILVKGDYKLQ